MKLTNNLRTAVLLLLLVLSGSSSADAVVSVSGMLNSWIDTIDGALASVLFFDVLPGDADFQFIVVWLVAGAVFLAVKMGFIKLRLLGHSIRVIRGKYSRADDVGEVTSFQALTAALSATVGLGNIAGVVIAIGIGGPGPSFWMIVGALDREVGLI